MIGRIVNTAVPFLVCLLVPAMALAESDASGIAGLNSGLTMGLAALGGTFAQGKLASSFMEAVGRNPGAVGSLSVWLMIALAFIESLVILGFVIAFMSV